MKSLQLTILLACFLIPAYAQKNPGFGNNSASDVCSQLSFSSDQEVIDLVNKILDYAGVVNRSYEVRGCTNASGCFATVINDQQYIIYQPDYLKDIKKYGFTNTSLPKANTDWQALTILAHEVGHLINTHFYRNRQDITPWDKELQSDEFAGKIIYHMNGSLEHAQSVFYTSIVPVEGTMSHPPRTQRLNAVAKGYNNAKALFPRMVTQIPKEITEETVTTNTNTTIHTGPQPTKKDYKDIVKMYETFNNGIALYNAKDYRNAALEFAKVAAYYEQNKFSIMDTIANQAMQTQAYCGYYSGDMEMAVTAGEKVLQNHIITDIHVYRILAEIYDSRNDKINFDRVIADGKKHLPDNKELVNVELNYYIKRGLNEQLLTKAEAALKKQSSNTDLLFTLGTIYTAMALPEGGGVNDFAFLKAEEYFNEALNYEPRIDVMYNLGALYYNKAVDFNRQMNAITGTTEADNKNYDALKSSRQAWFAKAAPEFERLVMIIENRTSPGESDKQSYRSSLQALYGIYGYLDNREKASEYKKKIEAAK